MNKGHLYFIMGVSGAGKGTLRENLDKLNFGDVEFLKSTVSRPIREGEIPGYIYNFVTLEEFNKSIENDEFLEYELVHKLHYYGTKKKDFYEGIESGKTMIKEIDIKGLAQLHREKPEIRNHITSVFLTLPEERVRERILLRGELSENEISNRLESMRSEIEEAKQYCDHIIDADKNPENVLEEFLQIIGKGKSI